MLYFLATRTLAAIPVMLMVSVIVFSILYFAPGDPAILMLGDLGTSAEVAAAKEKLGLNDPYLVQLLRFIGNILHGDLGNTLFFGKQAVTSLIIQRLEPTLALTLSTIIVCIVIAVPLGTLAAWRSGGLVDRCVMLISVVGFSIPTFVLGYTLVFTLAIKAQILPVQGYKSITEGIVPFIRSIALPTMTLGLAYLVLILRITRASVLDTLHEDYVRTAKAKGVSDVTLLHRHSLPNAAIPIITVVGLGMTSLISGVVITEVVFNIPGIGRLMLDAIVKRDYPLIQGIVIFVSFAYVIINLVVDVVYAYFDPRIRF